MASILRQIVAGPRIRHEETGLDLVYVTDQIIAMSMPAAEYPKMAYRNPISKVVAFLDEKHGDKWAVWEFRAEGCGYPDSAFHDRVFHSPWPDHHPPPFGLIPNIMASMRNHLKKDPENVAAIHCKAGKGRTGTVTCSYLISEEGWTKDDALARFTEKRMRPSFGAGVSIPSQLRYINYVDRWVNEYQKTYVERSVQVTEVHIWGLREGVKLGILGYVNEGKVMKVFHTFDKSEKTVVGEPNQGEDGNGSAVIFRPSKDVILPSNDICIDFEKRSKAAYGWTFVWRLYFLPIFLAIMHCILSIFVMKEDADKFVRKHQVSALAHCWFNAYFEGDEKSGVFTQEWEGMDGLKGTSRKGTTIFDKMQIVWQVIQHEKEIREPEGDEHVEGTQKADDTNPEVNEVNGRDLGLRPAAAHDSDAESLEETSGLSGAVKHLTLHPPGKSSAASSIHHSPLSHETSPDSLGTSTTRDPELPLLDITATADKRNLPSSDDSLSTPPVSAAWTASTSSADTADPLSSVLSPEHRVLSPETVEAKTISPVSSTSIVADKNGVPTVIATEPEGKAKESSFGTLKRHVGDKFVS